MQEQETNQWNVALGDLVTDRLTPFTGIVTARAEYLYGCKQVLVRADALKDGNPVEGVWMDEGRVEVVERQAQSMPETASVRAGADIAPPIR